VHNVSVLIAFGILYVRACVHVCVYLYVRACMLFVVVQYVFTFIARAIRSTVLATVLSVRVSVCACMSITIRSFTKMTIM